MCSPPNSIAERIEAVAAAYYRQMEQFCPLERDLIEWFVQLSTDDKTAAAGLRYERWPTLTGFKRYFLEKKGHSLPAYMARHLSAQELAHWADEAAGGPALGPASR